MYLLDYLRIRQAAGMLIYEPKKSIAEIGSLSGFTDTRRMYNAFQKRLSMTPGEFRDRYGV